MLIKMLIKLAICTAVFVSSTANAESRDFGEKVEKMLAKESKKLFGFKRPLSSSTTGSKIRTNGQSANDLIKVAKGLKAKILTRKAAQSADMFSFWPNEDNPEYLVFCIEGGVENLGTTLPGSTIEKLNPSVQRIDIDSGDVETILRGMDRCDGIRTTAWGTVLATEESGDGQAYELIDVANTTNHTITDRATGTIMDANGSPSTNIVKRDALPVMAWEGLTVTEKGVVIAGDELRPGTAAEDDDGGAIFKFVPAIPHTGGLIDDLSESPLVNGSVYAFRADCREETSGSFPQFGQGCEIGNGTWVLVSAADARNSANANGATGYYRPEDLHSDPTYTGPGIRFCWTNTGREAASNYGEVICGIDSEPFTAEPELATVVVNRFVEGDPDFNSLDNLAFQPITGNLYVIEDHSNGDIFACLPDGADRNVKTDGCVKMLSVKDQSAEPTGFEFTADGKTAFLAIQHSNDSACGSGTDCADFDDYGTDDIAVITGFKIKND